MMELLAQASPNPGGAVTVGLDWKQLLPLFAVGGPFLGLISYGVYWLMERRYGEQIRSLEVQLKNTSDARDLNADKFEHEKAQTAGLTATVAAQADQIKAKDAALAELTAKYDKVYAAGHDRHVKLEALKTQHAALTADHTTEKAAHALSAARLAAAEGDLRAASAELDGLRAGQKRTERRMRKIQKSQGYLTQEKANQ